MRDSEGELRDEVFFCADLAATTVQILEWAVRRWSVQVTFEQARAQVGVQTQRRWSDRARARTTPVLFGLFSTVTLLELRLSHQGSISLAATWSHKAEPTFWDCLALVRRHLGHDRFLVDSAPEAEFGLCRRELLDLLINRSPLAA